MYHVIHSAKRSAPARTERVWALLSDVENWPRVLPTFDSVSRLDGAGPVLILEWSGPFAWLAQLIFGSKVEENDPAGGRHLRAIG